MPVAHATLALLVLANHTTPRHALWNTTRDTCPDPIPRARDARATPEPPAHSVLAITLLHIGCSCTHRPLHTTETRTRLSERHAAARQTSSLVWKDTREPAFMMLGRTPTDHQLCIYAEHCNLTLSARPASQEAAQAKERGNKTETPGRAEASQRPDTADTEHPKNPTSKCNTCPLAGIKQHMQGNQAQASGRGASRQGGAEQPQRKRPASISPGSVPAGQQAAPKQNTQNIRPLRAL